MKNYCSIFKLIFCLSILSFYVNSCRNSKDEIDDPQTQTPDFTGVNTNARNLTVRFIYIVPSDKELKQTYTEAIANCATNLTTFYKAQLGNNKTFHVNSQIVETIKSSHPAAWFNANNGAISGTDPTFYFYSNAKSDLKALLGSSYDENKYTFTTYVDAQGTTGAGSLRLCIMPENDLLGLIGQSSEPVSRWIGGAGHELGHAFGLQHNADNNAIMWTGYTIYPNCYFLPADKTILNSNTFLY